MQLPLAAVSTIFIVTLVTIAVVAVIVIVLMAWKLGGEGDQHGDEE